MKKFHPFHMVDMSPWPILAASTLMICVAGLIQWLHFHSKTLLTLGSLILWLILLLWWQDIINESTFQGNHTKKVVKGLKSGMILFIISEIMFFFSFFWMFLHSAASPNIELGSMWPPMSIEPFNPLALPLLNTAILLASGVSLTWAHYHLIQNKSLLGLKPMLITILLGFLFTAAQAFEYINAPFTMANSIYGSAFFIMTGFHGLHVLIGAIFLSISAWRLQALHFSSHHHVGFECSAWYWHFVDVVWLALYLLLYWWGS